MNSLTNETQLSIQSTSLESLAFCPGKLSGPEIAHRLNLFSLVESVIQCEREHYKALLAADPTAIPGYELRPGRTLREFDTQATWKILSDTVTTEQFIKGCKIRVNAMKEIFSKATGIKGRAMDKEWTNITRSCVTEKQAQPSLVKSREVEARAATEDFCLELIEDSTDK